MDNDLPEVVITPDGPLSGIENQGGVLRKNGQVMGEVPLVRVYPEAEILMAGRGIATAAGKRMVATAVENVAEKGTTSLEKASGSYLLEFQSGKFYAGKGLESRMMKSINRIETKFGDKLLNKAFYPAANSNEAFINEHKLMMQFGGPKSYDKLSPTYNLIFSPGKKIGGF